MSKWTWLIVYYVICLTIGICLGYKYLLAFLAGYLFWPICRYLED